MKVLVTGANGYIGKSLCINLSSKYEITAITRKEVDLTDFQAVSEYFKDKYFDVVIHCAISGGRRLQEDGISVLDDNIKMFYNLEHNKNHFGRFINFGSGAEIYHKNKYYGLSKSVINQSIRTKEKFYNVRIFAVFDQNELDTRFIKTCITNYLNRQAIVIHADKHMDFFYMKDLITVVDYYISNEDPPFKEFNCSYGKPITLKQIAYLINHLENHKVPVIVESQSMEVDYISLTTQRILGLDYIGLESGIIETYNNLTNEKN